MFRLGAAITVGDDVHSLQMVQPGFIRPLAAQGVINIADIHNAGCQWDILTPQSIRITATVPTFVVIEGDLSAHLEID